MASTIRYFRLISTISNFTHAGTSSTKTSFEFFCALCIKPGNFTLMHFCETTPTRLFSDEWQSLMNAPNRRQNTILQAKQAGRADIHPHPRIPTIMVSIVHTWRSDFSDRTRRSSRRKFRPNVRTGSSSWWWWIYEKQKLSSSTNICVDLNQ